MYIAKRLLDGLGKNLKGVIARGRGHNVDFWIHSPKWTQTCQNKDHTHHLDIRRDPFRRSLSSLGPEKRTKTGDIPRENSETPIDNGAIPFDKEGFVKLLRLSSTRSSDLLAAINKCKDELRKLSTESHPFTRHDLHVLMQLLSEVLAIKTSKKEVELFNNVLESFRADSKFPSALGLCTMFSSTNDSKAKLPSISLVRLFANKIGMMGAKFLAPKLMKMIDEDYKKGVECALKYLSEAINTQDFKALESCCETRLFNLIKGGIEYLGQLKLKVKYEPVIFHDIKMDKFVLTIGGKRNDVFKGPHSFKEAMAHQIILPQPDVLPDREGYKKLVFKTVDKGIILRMEVVLYVRQSFSLLDDDNNVVWSDVNQNSSHRLYFESELIPEQTSSGASGMKFDCTDWVLVDINGALCGNNPF